MLWKQCLERMNRLFDLDAARVAKRSVRRDQHSRRRDRPKIGVEQLEDRVTPAAPVTLSRLTTGNQSIYIGTDQANRMVRMEVTHPNESSASQQNGVVHLTIDPLQAANGFVLPGEFTPQHQFSANNFNFNSGAFFFEDVPASPAFLATGLGDINDAGIVASVSITGGNPSSVSSSFNIPNVSNPDLQFAIGSGTTEQTVFNGLLGPLAGGDLQDKELVPAQTIVVDVLTGQTRGVALRGNMPLPDGAPEGLFAGGARVFTPFLIEIEQFDLPPGWSVFRRVPTDSVLRNEQREFFIENGEFIFGEFADFQLANGETVAFGNLIDFGITASPDATVPGGSVARVRIKAFSVGFGNFILKDVVEIQFRKPVVADLTADAPLKEEVGINISEIVPSSAQTIGQDIRIGRTEPYFVNVVNRSPDAASYTLKAAASNNPNFTVRYFSDDIGTDVTDQITGAGFVTDQLAANGGRQIITVEIEAGRNAMIAPNFDQVIQVFIGSSTQVADAVRLEATAKAPADLLARDFFLDGPFLGDGGFTVVSAPLSRGETLTYLARVENDRLDFAKQFRLFANVTELPGVKFKFLDENGADVTAAITDPSLRVLTTLLEPGATHDFFVTVSAAENIIGEINENFESSALIFLSDPNSADPQAQNVDSINLKPDLVFPADLQVEGDDISLPDQPVAIGSQIELRYTVGNVGIETTETAAWTDLLVLDVNGDGEINLSTGNDVLLGQVRVDGPVNGKDGYAKSLTVTVPGVAPGVYKVLVATDFGGEVVEDNNRSNNLGKSIATITIEANPDIVPPDLTNVTTELNPDGSFTVAGDIGDSNFEELIVSISTAISQVVQTTAVPNARFQVSIPAGQAQPGETIFIKADDGNGGVTTQTTTLPAANDGPPNPTDFPTVYVNTLYELILNRAPDAQGGEFWSDLVANGANPLDVARGIWESVEHRGQQVESFYQTFLGRGADPFGLETWIAAFLNGATEQDVMFGFVSSEEFLARHATVESLITALYANLLGRDPDQVGFDAFLAISTQPDFHQKAVDIILASAEYFSNAIARYYEDFLGRAPDEVGADGWLAELLAKRLTEAGVAQNILASDELFGREAP